MVLNAAVVGTGFIGPVHAEALARIGVRVRGILGSSPEKSRQAAQALGLEMAYDSYDAILNDDAVHAVHITTPNKTHADMAARALRAGKHVVCEKPLAMHARETAELVALAAQHASLVSAVNYNIRFYPLMHHARDLVASGELGDIRAVRGGYVQDWLLHPTDFNWRVLAEEGGDLRAIGDIGTHWMDLIGFITGLRAEAVFADLLTVHPVRLKPTTAVATFKGKESAAPVEYESVPITTDDHGSVLFRYAGGARGTMNVSQVTPGRKNFLNFEIAGSKASLAWNSENPNELWIGQRDAANQIVIKDPALMRASARAINTQPGGHTEGFADTFRALYRVVYDYIAAGDFAAPRPFPTFEDGHHEVVLCEKILESHRSERWVTV
jgi:predicted dehydrogenase